MSTDETVTTNQASDTAAIEVRTEASPAHISTLRAVVADLAMHADYDLDSVSDLRLAVDEACSTLVELAAASTTLDCAFYLEPDGIRVRASVIGRTDAIPDQRGFSWQVLTTLTDSVASVTEDSRVSIELTKRKPHSS